MVEKPSQQLNDLLQGNRSINDVHPSVRSWAQLYIYWAAEEIMNQPDKSARNRALSRMPANLQAVTKQEVIRLWNMRLK